MLLRSLTAFTTVFLAFAASASATSLHVSSFPGSAEVFVDSVTTGKFTPMSVTISEGTHDVTVQIAASGWNPTTTAVIIEPGKNELSVTLLPTLTIGPVGSAGAGWSPLHSSFRFYQPEN